MSQPITVNYNRPALSIPPGRTTVYSAYGSGTLTITIGSDGSQNVVAYIEYDGMVSDPIPGNVGLASPVTITFNQYLLVYYDNVSYTNELGPSLSVAGTVVPPVPTVTSPQSALPASLGIDLGQLFNMMFSLMILSMFVRMMSAFSKSV